MSGLSFIGTCSCGGAIYDDQAWLYDEDGYPAHIECLNSFDADYYDR